MSDKIVMLRGPERVRRRPAVIFGGDDIDATMTALQMLINVLAQDGINSHCTRITVTQYQDNSIEIQDNGRGIFLGLPDSTDHAIWKDLFCELYAGPRYDSNATARCIFEKPTGKEGEYTDSLDICSVQYASEYMDVSVVRDGYRQELRFKKGYNNGGLSCTPCSEPTGTYIRFKPDSEVFSEIALPEQKIADKLQAIAIQIPGMTTTFRRETLNGFEEIAFCYPKGIADYLQEQNRDRESSPIYSAKLTGEGQDRYNRPRYAATAVTGVCFVKDAGFVKCYHNLKELTCRGTHCDGAIHNIAQRLEWMLECEISAEKLLKHLQLVIVTNSERTDWANGARTGLQSIFIRDLTQDTVDDDFHHFVKMNKEFLYDLFNK